MRKGKKMKENKEERIRITRGDEGRKKGENEKEEKRECRRKHEKERKGGRMKERVWEET